MVIKKKKKMDIRQYNNNNATEDVFVDYSEVSESYIARYVSKVYAWMVLGLSITAIIAFSTTQSSTILNMFFENRFMLIGLFLVQLFLVGYLSLRIQKMTFITALSVFMLYAGLNGLTFGAILAVYTASSIAAVFGITAGTFAIMSAVGYFTKQDLTSFGKIMMMGLVGIIIASVVNMFLGSSTLYWIISYVGVGVFVGLIAYDTQKIKSYALIADDEMRKKAGIMGALSLYLDFVNLFLMLLRLFGSSRN